MIQASSDLTLMDEFLWGTGITTDVFHMTGIIGVQIDRRKRKWRMGVNMKAKNSKYVFITTQSVAQCICIN